MINKVRKVLDKLPLYQQFPDTLLHKLKITTRNIIVFISESLNETRTSRCNRKQIQIMKNRYYGEILLLGSGPSLNNVTLEQIQYFRKQGGMIAATNSFVLSEKFKEINIDFYFLIDSYFWNKDKNKKVVEKIQFLINTGKFDGYIVQPAGKEDLFTGYKKTSYIDTRGSLFRKKRGIKPDKRTSLAYSVVLAAIYTLNYYGFSRILFAGLDSNFARYYQVTPINSLVLNKGDYYAEKQFNTENSDKKQDKSIYLSQPSYLVRDMRDALYSNAFFLDDFRKISEKCINVGHDISNDVSARASLLS